MWIQFCKVVDATLSLSNGIESKDVVNFQSYNIMQLVRAHYLTPCIWRLKLKRACENFKMVLGQGWCWCMLMDKLNLQKPNKQLVSISWNQMVLRFNHKQFQLTWITQFKPLIRHTTFILIIYFVISNGGYIKMVNIPRTCY